MALVKTEREKVYWDEVKAVLKLEKGFSGFGGILLNLAGNLITLATLVTQGVKAIYSNADIEMAIIAFCLFVASTAIIAKGRDSSIERKQIIFTFYCSILKGVSIYLLFSILLMSATTDKGLILDVSTNTPYITFGRDFSIASGLIIALIITQGLIKYCINNTGGRYLPFYNSVSVAAFVFVAILLIIGRYTGNGLDFTQLKAHYFDDPNITETLSKFTLLIISSLGLFMHAIEDVMEKGAKSETKFSIRSLSKGGVWIIKSSMAALLIIMCIMAITGSNTNSDYEDALANIDEGKVSRGFTELVKLANSGYPLAMEKLGDLYHSGELITHSPEMALKLYKDAMAYDLTSARFKVGVMYFRAEGLQQRELDVAQDYISKAAAGGYEPAKKFLKQEQFNIGVVDKFRLQNAYISLVGCVESAKFDEDILTRLMMSTNDNIKKGIFGESMEHNNDFEVKFRGRIESEKVDKTISQCRNDYTTISTARVVN